VRPVLQLLPPLIAVDLLVNDKSLQQICITAVPQVIPEPLPQRRWQQVFILSFLRIINVFFFFLIKKI
jgi:hypothetical protein